MVCLSGVPGGGGLVAFRCRKERILGPLAQHEYREAASTQTHAILLIRSHVSPKKVLSVACHSHFTLTQLKHQHVCTVAESVSWSRLKC